MLLFIKHSSVVISISLGCETISLLLNHCLGENIPLLHLSIGNIEISPLSVTSNHWLHTQKLGGGIRLYIS